MADSTEYFLATGEQDRERLTIINQLYNPEAIEFMKLSGLKEGMTVLEVGCGTGHMAVELAKVVGKTGKVIASDISETQLAIAKQTAIEAKCTNIEFLQLDINEPLSAYYDQFDFIYGRWVMEFTKNPEFTFNELYKTLKHNGVFSYEGVDVSDREYFSYPHEPIVDKWFELILRNWQSNKMHIHFVKWLYFALKKIDSKDLKIDTHQVILITPREKSIVRLGLMSVAETYFKKGFITKDEYDEMINNLERIEQSEILIGYVRNILVSGRKIT